MTSTSVSCPECTAKIKVGPGALGKKIRCPKCQAPFVVPAKEDDDQVPAAPIRPANGPSQKTARKSAPAPVSDEASDEEPVVRKPSRSNQNAQTSVPEDRKGARRGERADSEEEDERPRKRKPKASKTKGEKANRTWIYLAAGAAVLLIAGGSVAWLLSGPSAKKPADLANVNPGPRNPGTPTRPNGNPDPKNPGTPTKPAPGPQGFSVSTEPGPVITVPPRVTLREAKYYVSGVTFSSDSKTLIAGSDDSHIHLWDVVSGTQRLPINHQDRV